MLINSVINNLSPIIIVDSLFIVPTWASGETSRNKFLDSKIYVFNSKTKLMKEEVLSYPHDLLDINDKNNKDLLALLVVKCEVQNNLIVYCWPGSKFIGIRNKLHPFEYIKFLTIKNSSIVVPSEYRDGLQVYQYLLDYTCVSHLLYDNENNFIYVFYTTPTQLSHDVKIKDYKGSFLKNIVIQVLDTSFTELGIINLPHSTYDIVHSFIYKGKLFISESNEFNPGLNENEINFSVFTFN